MWVSRLFAIAAVGIACGCIADPIAPPGPAGGALGGAPVAARLSVEDAAPHVPRGGDGARRLALAWTDAQGRRDPVALATPAIAAVEWNGGAAVLDEDRVLWRIAPGRAPERIAGDVVAPPAARGGDLAYAVADGGGGVRLHVRERVVPGLGAAGLLRFDGDRLLLVGARPGGVAGVWSLPLDGGELRCHSNCELRAGRPWGSSFVPPPRTLEELAAP